MELQIINADGIATGSSFNASDAIFDRQYSEALVHQVVVAYLAAGRAGTRAQKNRSAVRGGGAKPWRQKGTGRARAGTSRSPLWRSGGVTFAASPQNHAQKVNRKMYRAAIRSILSELRRNDRLRVVDSLAMETPRTRMMVERLERLGITGSVLFIAEMLDQNFYLASRNLFRVGISDVQGLDPASLVHYEHIVITVDAMNKIEEWLG